MACWEHCPESHSPIYMNESMWVTVVDRLSAGSLRRRSEIEANALQALVLNGIITESHEISFPTTTSESKAFMPIGM